MIVDRPTLEAFKRLLAAAKTASINDKAFQASINFNTLRKLGQEIARDVPAMGKAIAAIPDRPGPTGLTLYDVHLWIDRYLDNGEMLFEPAQPIAYSFEGDRTD